MNRRKAGAWGFAAAWMASALAAALFGAGAPVRAARAVHVKGNRLVDETGNDVRLRGVNIASLEWSNTGENLLNSVRKATAGWHAALIRLPVSQDRWFGHAPGQSDGGAAYRKIVDSVLDAAWTAGCAVDLDLHWSNMNRWGRDIGQHKMPDGHSLEFWRDAAARYANRPGVLFGLYNEPHEVTWPVWRSGGSVTEPDSTKRPVTYDTPGMQALLDAIRSTGARNLVIAGGLDWAYDLAGIANGFALSDPNGLGVVYDTHVYPWKGQTPAQWDPHVSPAARTAPILVGESGCEPKDAGCTTGWPQRVLDWIDARGYSWTAWDMHPAAGPSLIAD